MAIEVICMEDPAFYALIETVVKRIQATIPSAELEFIPPSRVREILKIGKTKLNDLKNSGELEYYQEREGTKVMYLTKSVYEYQKGNLK